LALMPRVLRVGVDGTTWSNDRGFGRFTREIVKALVGRAEPEGFHYTLLLDERSRADSSCDPVVPGEGGPDESPSASRAADTPAYTPADKPDQLASSHAALEILRVATSRPTSGAAAGSDARSALDLLRLGRAAGSGRFDVFLFPAVYSYFPLLARTPCSVVFHDTIAERFPELVFATRRNQLLWNGKVALARRQARRVIAVSQASARDLATRLRIPRERIDVVSEAADARFQPVREPGRLAAARLLAGCQGDEPLLLAVGGLSPHKNLRRLLEAMPALLERHPSARLAIVGDLSGRGFYDEAESLQRAVTQHPLLAERVRFTGFVSDDQLVNLYSAATLLVFPSLWEGFGLPAIEAMACGLPVAASHSGSLPEVAGDAGRYFDPSDAADISRVLDEMLRAAAAGGLVRLSERGRVLAARNSWSRAAAELEHSLRRTAQPPGARSPQAAR
jgi:glycosyltransferase involved in cell wall biosynthesis